MTEPVGLTVRPERAADIDAVRKLNKKAFKGKAESKLVNALRGTEWYVPELALVAELEGRVAGHLLLSLVEIKEGDRSVPALALAPMGVLPEFQGRGIGSALVKRGLAEAARLGHKLVVVVGHPEYYPRFGFVPAGEKGLRLPFECPPEAFMALELAPGALAGVSGEVSYPPPFHKVI